MPKLVTALSTAAVILALTLGIGCIKKSRQAASLDSSDFPSIQAALDALPESGGAVTVPAGIHKVQEPVRIRRSNVTLEGKGRGTVILNENREGKPAIIARSDRDPENNPLWGVTISNMCITGDSAAVWEAGAWPEGEDTLCRGGDGILADHCYDSLFEKLWLVRNGGNGLNLYYCYENPRVQSCNISYNRQAGIRMEGSHDIVVSANQLEENYRQGILAIDGYNLIASGNDLDDHRGDGIVLDRMGGSTLSGNMVEESRGWGLVLRDSFGTAFSAGLIRHNFTGGVRLERSRYNTVSGCVFEGNDSLALYNDQESFQNNFTGNTVSQGAFKPGETVSRGFHLEGRENLVSANLIAPGAGYGLILSGERQNVSENTIIASKGDSCMLIENLKSSLVKDNFLSGGSVSLRGLNPGNRVVDNR
ncbi:MAG TPA: right-handed parallel beta-helix repeat-containing protein [archaeon]|nr:right-handed parallel beta-helix repeat-containing protein [archaeon]